MSSSIRIPESTPLPDRDTFQSNFESSTKTMPMEIGGARQRRMRSIAPRRWTLKITMSTVQYQEFDYWFQNAINGGASLFDMQLLDDDQTLVWYTVNALDGYGFENVANDADTWIITMTVRSKLPSFTDRVPGTNDLHGDAELGISSAGVLHVPYTMRGAASLGLSAQTRLGSPRMQGRTDMGVVLAGTFQHEFFQGRAQITLTASGTFNTAHVMYGLASIGISTATGVMADPYFSSVVTLLHFNGSNGSTTVTDSAGTPNSFAVTTPGALSTAQAKFGSASYQPGSTGRLKLSGAALSQLSIGNRQFTFEVWVYPLSTTASIIVDLAVSNGVTPLALQYTSGKIQIFGFNSAGTGGGLLATSTNSLNLNSWNFTQLRVRDDGSQFNWELSINGTIDNLSGVTVTAPNNWIFYPTVDFGIGNFASGPNTPFDGYIDDIRFTIGVARPFQVPTIQFLDH